MSDVTSRIVQFVDDVLKAMDLDVEIQVEERDDSVRLSLQGDSADVLVQRQGEALDALQHLANTAFRRQLRDSRHVVIDARGFRSGKDAELKQIAQFLMERAKSTGTPQEIGPLNSYARRLVHLTVAEDPQLSSESIGDAAMKTVIISLREPRR
jgi:spoIIIJ-associated protein